MNSSGNSQKANFFALFQKDPNCYFEGVRIDFSSIKDHFASVGEGSSVFKKIIPTFNNDGLYFTDSFVIEKQDLRCRQVQSSELSEKVEELKSKFDKKIQKIVDQMETQEIEQPEPENNFCQICRLSFESYSQHIKTRDHIRNLEFSKGHKYVHDICKQFKRRLSTLDISKQQKVSRPPSKTKPIKQKKPCKKKSNKITIGSKGVQKNTKDKTQTVKNLPQLDNTYDLKSKKIDLFENKVNDSCALKLDLGKGSQNNCKEVLL